MPGPGERKKKLSRRDATHSENKNGASTSLCFSRARARAPFVGLAALAPPQDQRPDHWIYPPRIESGRASGSPALKN